MALVMFMIFILVVVVARVAYQYRLSGDHGIRPANRQASTVNKAASALLIFSFIGIFGMSIVDIFRIDDTHFTDSVLWLLFGFSVSIFGIGFTNYSQFAMGMNWRMGLDENEETALVTTGIYRYIRNPIYSGVALFLIGQLLLMPHLAVVLFLALALFSIHIHVRYIEEPYLSKLHGEHFVRYKKSTRAYIPKIQ